MALPQIGEIRQAFRELRCRDRNAKFVTQSVIFLLNLREDRLFPIGSNAADANCASNDDQQSDRRNSPGCGGILL